MVVSTGLGRRFGKLPCGSSGAFLPATEYPIGGHGHLSPLRNRGTILAVSFQGSVPNRLY